MLCTVQVLLAGVGRLAVDVAEPTEVQWRRRPGTGAGAAAAAAAAAAATGAAAASTASAAAAAAVIGAVTDGDEADVDEDFDDSCRARSVVDDATDDSSCRADVDGHVIAGLVLQLAPGSGSGR